MKMSQAIPDEFKSQLNELLTPAVTFGELKGLKPETLETMYSVAHTLYESNQYQKAREIFQTLTLLNHFEYKYFFGLASCLQMEKNYERAAHTFGLCYMLEPEEPAVPFHSAYCHMMLGDYKAAKSGFYAAALWAGEKKEYAALKERAQMLEKQMNRKLENQEKEKSA